MTSRDLFCSRAKQDHAVSAGKARLRPEGEFALARPKLGFNRTERQPQLLYAAPQDVHRRCQHVETRFREILVALRQKADLGRFRRPGRIGGRETRILELEEVEFDFKPGEKFKPRIGKRVQRIATPRAR